MMQVAKQQRKLQLSSAELRTQVHQEAPPVAYSPPLHAILVTQTTKTVAQWYFLAAPLVLVSSPTSVPGSLLQ